ncbi:hypothetical protein, partial [Enterobacter intestinihominis]
TNWAHYHIASEPLAPGRVGPDLTGLLSPIIINLLENKPENRYHNVDGLIADHRRSHATLTPERDIVDIITGHQDRSNAIHIYAYLLYEHTHGSDLIARFFNDTATTDLYTQSPWSAG